MTLSCDKIYEAFLGLVTDHHVTAMSKEDAYELMKDCFENVFSKMKIRKLFSDLDFDENILQLSYTLRNSVDESYDQTFVKNLFANGMVVAWLSPRYNSETYILQFFGGKEAKWFAQSSHMQELKEMYNNARKVVDKDYVRDHGYGALLIKQQNGGA